MDMDSFVKLVVWTLYSMFDMKLHHLHRLRSNHNAIDALLNSLQHSTPWQNSYRRLMDSRRTWRICGNVIDVILKQREKVEDQWTWWAYGFNTHDNTWRDGLSLVKVVWGRLPGCAARPVYGRLMPQSINKYTVFVLKERRKVMMDVTMISYKLHIQGWIQRRQCKE
jgi:hypothetical protein